VAKVHLTESSPTEVTLGHNVNSKDEVGKVLEQAKQGGAIITDPAHETFWGGYSDPDGHLWEVVWNPQWDTVE